MWMGRSRNIMACLLAYPHRSQTLDEENPGYCQHGPTNKSQTNTFLSWFCYVLLWYVAAPLTYSRSPYQTIGSKRFIWKNFHQQAFDAMKALMVEDALLRYPDHNVPFHFYTNASDYPLGVVILQMAFPLPITLTKLLLPNAIILSLKKNSFLI